jgi:hypothetical protein
LRQKKVDIGSKEKVFQFSLDAYARFWKKVLSVYGWQDLGGPHLNRHSGAIYLIHYLGWSMPRVQEHGRWLEERSIRHYGKRHVVIKNEERLSTTQLERGRWLREDFEQRLGVKSISPTIAGAAGATTTTTTTSTLEGSSVPVVNLPTSAFPELPPVDGEGQ